jgi:tetratricopeptide (TPR) repeat protein
LEKALALYQNFLKEPGPDPAGRLLTAYVSIRLGDIEILLDHRDEAVLAYQKAVVLLQQLVAEFPQEVGFRSSLAKAHFQVAWLRRGWLHPQESEEDYRRAISLYEDLRNEFPDVAWYTRELGSCWFKLAGLQRSGGHFQLGEEGHRRALALRQQLFDQLPDDSAQREPLSESHGELAWVLAIRPDREPRHTTEALVHARKAVELDPGNDDRWHTLGVAHCRAGNWQEALAALEKSKQLQPQGNEVGSFQLFFEAMARAKLGHREEARRCYDQGVRWMAKHAPNHADLRRFRAEAAAVLGVK